MFRNIIKMKLFEFRPTMNVHVHSCCISVVSHLYLWQTLRVDYSKNLEGVLGILCQMISGKSFELILSAAAVTGKLPSLIVELIK